jgi:hypothetical protein
MMPRCDIPVRPEIRQQVLERDGHRCLHCDTTDDLQIDHIWPASFGGPPVPGNLQTLCGPCNRSKGIRHGDARYLEDQDQVFFPFLVFNTLLRLTRRIEALEQQIQGCSCKGRLTRT